MRLPLRLLVVLLFLSLIPALALATQKKLALGPRILLAKTVYFDNQTGSDAVGNAALAQLKKWGKFQIVPDREHADLVLLLSADPYSGGRIIMSGGQTGSIDSRGRAEEDPIPRYGAASPARYAYLTVIDPATCDNLWSAEHPWGGLLTGFSSAGSSLIKKLEKLAKKESRFLGNPYPSTDRSAGPSPNCKVQ